MNGDGKGQFCFGEGNLLQKQRKNWGASGVPNGLTFPQGHDDSEYVLILKLDNGEMVSTADKQTHRQRHRITEPLSTSDYQNHQFQMQDIHRENAEQMFAQGVNPGAHKNNTP